MTENDVLGDPMEEKLDDVPAFIDNNQPKDELVSTTFKIDTQIALSDEC